MSTPSVYHTYISMEKYFAMIIYLHLLNAMIDLLLFYQASTI